MRTRTKIWLMIAASFVLLGCVLFAGVMTKLDWDFMKLSTVNYETNTHVVSEAFDSISIDTDTADIVFALSEDGRCRVELYEDENAKHSVTVENNMLAVKINHQKAWHGYIGFHFSSPKITVYLPRAEWALLLIREETGDVEIPKAFRFEDVDISSSTGDVVFCASVSKRFKVKTSTGDIRVESICAGALDLSTSTGKVTVSDVTCEGAVAVGVSTGKTYLSDIACKSVISKGSTGDIFLDSVIAAEKLSIKRSTGDVKFDGSDAAEIFVETDTGDVTGTLASDKAFVVETDTGSVDVPKTVTGGICEIMTATGDISINIKQEKSR